MEQQKEQAIRCAFCGGIMRWDADFTSEEYGQSVEGKLIATYTCTECGATATFEEKIEQEEQK